MTLVPAAAGGGSPCPQPASALANNANANADAKGTAKWVFTTTRVTVGAGPLSIFDEDGTAIIIHANPDQGVTAEAKAGLSGGPRAACGVLTK